MAKVANKVVLVIEDNPVDQKMMVRAFGKWSPRNEIAVAHDGVAALDYLLGEGCEERPVPALVLLALKLLRVDGLEVLRRIRAHDVRADDALRGGVDDEFHQRALLAAGESVP